MPIGPNFSQDQFLKESAIEQDQLRKNQPQQSGSAEANAHFAQTAISDEAKAIGYRSGIIEITFLAQRIIALEQKVAALEKAQQQPAHLRKALNKIPQREGR